MGTSTPFPGPNDRNPLVPDWVPALEPPLPPPDQPTPTPDPNPPMPAPVPDPVPEPGRFRTPRSQLSNFSSSNGGNSKALKRGASGYVGRSTGGASHAAQRMGAARATSGELVRFLTTVVQDGVQEALREFNLSHLAGNTLDGIFVALMEQLCPPGGPIDEGIARDAFMEMLDALPELGIQQLSDLNDSNVQLVFELYATNCIEARLCNDVANQVIMLPQNPQLVEGVLGQLKDLIQGSVQDAMARAHRDFTTLKVDQVQRYVDGVYQETFRILQSLGTQGGKP